MRNVKGKIFLVLIIVTLFVALYTVQLTKGSADITQEQYTTSVEERNDECCITYYDSNGAEFIVKDGYSKIIELKDSYGNILRENYYIGDTPVKGAFGQYGIGYEYDSKNRITKITYLDAFNKPTINSLGYAIVKRTYCGFIKKDMYYDTNGMPIPNKQGSFGTCYLFNNAIAVDERGNLKFSFSSFSSNYPLFVVLLGSVITFLLVYSKRRNKVFFLILYICFLLFITLARSQKSTGVNLKFFWSYRQFFTNYSLRLEILNNIWLFIPLGAGIRSLLRKPYFLLIPLLFSITIEAAQYFFGLGLCEFDDIFSNTLGGCIGFLMAYEIEQIVKQVHLKWKKKSNHTS